MTAERTRHLLDALRRATTAMPPTRRDPTELRLAIDKVLLGAPR